MGSRRQNRCLKVVTSFQKIKQNVCCWILFQAYEKQEKFASKLKLFYETISKAAKWLSKIVVRWSWPWDDRLFFSFATGRWDFWCGPNGYAMSQQPQFDSRQPSTMVVITNLKNFREGFLTESKVATMKQEAASLTMKKSQRFWRKNVGIDNLASSWYDFYLLSRLLLLIKTTVLGLPRSLPLEFS